MTGWHRNLDCAPQKSLKTNNARQANNRYKQLFGNKIKGDQKNLTTVFGHISALQAPMEKTMGFFQVPVHADFEKVPNFMPG